MSSCTTSCMTLDTRASMLTSAAVTSGGCIVKLRRKKNKRPAPPPPRRKHFRRLSKTTSPPANNNDVNSDVTDVSLQNRNPVHGADPWSVQSNIKHFFRRRNSQKAPPPSPPPPLPLPPPRPHRPKNQTCLQNTDANGNSVALPKVPDNIEAITMISATGDADVNHEHKITNIDNEKIPCRADSSVICDAEKVGTRTDDGANNNDVDEINSLDARVVTGYEFDRDESTDTRFAKNWDDLELSVKAKSEHQICGLGHINDINGNKNASVDTLVNRMQYSSKRRRRPAPLIPSASQCSQTPHTLTVNQPKVSERPECADDVEVTDKVCRPVSPMSPPPGIEYPDPYVTCVVTPDPEQIRPSESLPTLLLTPPTPPPVDISDINRDHSPLPPPPPLPNFTKPQLFEDCRQNNPGVQESDDLLPLLPSPPLPPLPSPPPKLEEQHDENFNTLPLPSPPSLPYSARKEDLSISENVEAIATPSPLSPQPASAEERRKSNLVVSDSIVSVEPRSHPLPSNENSCNARVLPHADVRPELWSAPLPHSAKLDKPDTSTPSTTRTPPDITSRSVSLSPPSPPPLPPKLLQLPTKQSSGPKATSAPRMSFGGELLAASKLKQARLQALDQNTSPGIPQPAAHKSDRFSGDLRADLLRAVQARAWQRSGKVDEEENSCVGDRNRSNNHTSFPFEGEDEPIPDYEDAITTGRSPYIKVLPKMDESADGGDKENQTSTQSHSVFSNELQMAFRQRETRRSVGAINILPYKNSRYYKAEHVTTKRNSKVSRKESAEGERRCSLDSSEVLMKNISKIEQKHRITPESKMTPIERLWTPAEDLADDDLGDCFLGAHTDRAADFYQVNWAQMQNPPHIMKHKSRLPGKSKRSRIKKMQWSLRNVFKSSPAKARYCSMRELANDGWMIMPSVENDKAPNRVGSTHYAIHSKRGDVYLLPHISNVAPSESASTNYMYAGPHKQHHHYKEPLSIDQERQMLHDAETPFHMIQQMHSDYTSDEYLKQESSGASQSPVWQIMASPPCATIRSTHSGWSDATPSPRRSRACRTNAHRINRDEGDDHYPGNGCREATPSPSRSRACRTNAHRISRDEGDDHYPGNGCREATPSPSRLRACRTNAHLISGDEGDDHAPGNGFQATGWREAKPSPHGLQSRFPTTSSHLISEEDADVYSPGSGSYVLWEGSPVSKDDDGCSPRVVEGSEDNLTVVSSADNRTTSHQMSADRPRLHDDSS